MFITALDFIRAVSRVFVLGRRLHLVSALASADFCRGGYFPFERRRTPQHFWCRCPSPCAVPGPLVAFRADSDCGDEAARVLAEALKVNTTITTVALECVMPNLHSRLTTTAV